jgi:hypothetical protein
MAHDQEVVGSNPSTVYWMDVSDDASYYIKEKLKIKVGKMGHTKKIFNKKMLWPIYEKNVSSFLYNY